MTSTRSPARRPPRRDAAENRRAILDAARTVLNNDPDASLETIATTAGLSRRAVYGHFATRDELIHELHAQGLSRMNAAILPIHHDDARIALALIAARLWREVESVRVTAQLALRGPGRDAVAHGLDPVRRTVLHVVQQGVASGQIRADIEARILSRLIENAAISVLNESVRTSISREEGHRLVMLAALSTAGLSWREARELIASASELSLPEYHEDDHS